MATARGSRRNRGQVLVITALVVIMLLLSAVIYVNETLKNTPVSKPEVDADLSAVRQVALHTVVSALANVSNGGNTTVLAEDLDMLESALASHCCSGAILVVNSALASTSPYEDGFWVSWGDSGDGVSSACAQFTLNSTGARVDNYLEYTVNITSALNVVGDYERLTGYLKEVNLTCTVTNEGGNALAEAFTVYYEYDGSLSTQNWIQASPSLTDYGNGTYLIQFTAETMHRNDPMLVSVHCLDTRGISVWANATCTQT